MSLLASALIEFFPFCQYDSRADDLTAKVNRRFIQAIL